MDIQSLRYAVTLAEELHFGRAAQRHYISQQPFGRHIQRLENELGFALFNRTSRRVTLTAEGERVVAEARTILADVDQLIDMRRWDEPAAETLTVGVLGFGLAERWPDLATAVAGGFPDLTFIFHELNLADQYDAIRVRQVDFGIVQYAGPVDGLTFDRVLTMPRVAVVPVRSAYADADRLTPADVENAPWVQMARLHPSIADWAGPGMEHVPQDERGVRNPSAIPAAVSVTGRLSLHAAAACRFYPHPAVRFIPMDGQPFEVAIATRDTDDRASIAAIRRAAHFVATQTPLQAAR